MTTETQAPEGLQLSKEDLFSGIGDSFAASLKDLLTELRPEAEMHQEPSDPGLKALTDYVSNQEQAPGATQVIALGEDGKTWDIVSRDDVAKEAQLLEMRQAVLAPITNQLNNAFGLGLPLGDIVVGGIPGVFVSDVLDGMIAPQNADGSANFVNLFWRGVIAVTSVTFAKQFLGTRPAAFFAGVIVLQGAANLLPLDQWVARIVAQLRGFGGGAGMGHSMIHRQADQIAATFNQTAPIVSSPSQDALGATFGR